MPSNLPRPSPLEYIDCGTIAPNASGPKRKIFTQADIDPWFSSKAYTDLETYTLELCHSVQGKSIEEDCYESEVTLKAVAFVKEAEQWIDEIPLQTTPQRFGNKAFRDWLERVKNRNDEFQHSLLSSTSLGSIVPELSFNFIASFGSGARLDYGTGHELSFLLWLLSLRLVGVLTARDNQAVVLRVFAAYIDLVRKLQRVFKLEPAGSKGVWGLDDHQHLVYLFGASQLIDHPTFRPSQILQPHTLLPLSTPYLFPSSILHIHTLKTGPFSEHSPLLHQIASTVPNWSKVQTGLWKMYREEVLAKVPVVQHLRFGSTIRWIRSQDCGELGSSRDGTEGDDDGDDDQDTASEHDQRANVVRAPWIHEPLTNQRAGMTTLSHAAARRTPQAVPPSSGSTTQFAPPTLFPTRAPRTTVSSMAAGSSAPNRRTLAPDAGAVDRNVSPLGVLEGATTTRTSASLATTKAPWAT